MSKPESNRERFGYLPHVLSLFLPKIGEDAVMLLVAHFGGTTLCGGKESKRKLVKVLGPDVAEKILATMKENVILQFDVPVLLHFSQKRRTEAIGIAYTDLVPISDIARMFGMTQRGVYMAIRRLRDEGKLAVFENGMFLERAKRRRDNARSRYANGERIEDIAKSLGVTVGKVLQYLDIDQFGEPVSCQDGGLGDPEDE